MRDSRELYSSPSLFSTLCEVSDGTFAPAVHTAEALTTTVSCENPGGENIITCKDSRRELFVIEAGGLAFDTILKSDIQGLPSYIPMFDYRTILEAFKTPSPVIGIDLNNILQTAVYERAGMLVETRIKFRTPEIIRTLCRDKKVILFLSGPDTLIELVWYHRESCALFNHIKEMEFWAVTGFNFSVFGGECPFAQALNQKRSLKSSELLEQSGLQTIPHVYAITKYHIERYCEWFAQNPSIKTFTINCQMQKADADIRQLVNTIRTILDRFPTLHVILQGFRFTEAWQLGELLPRVHFADTKGVKYGENHQKIENNPHSPEKIFSSSSREDFRTITQYNIAARSKQLDAIYKTSIKCKHPLKP